MRILIGSNRYFGDVAGGGNRIAWDVAKFLADEGNEVYLLCEGLPDKPAYEERLGVGVLRYRTSPFDLHFARRHQEAAKRLLQRYLSGKVPDIIWGHMPLQMEAMLEAFPSSYATYTMHSPASEEMLESRDNRRLLLKLKSKAILNIERRCCDWAEVITVLSEFTKSELLRLHGKESATKVRITPGWTDLTEQITLLAKSEAKRRISWNANGTALFCLRRLVPRMGLDRLVFAAAIVRDKGLDFHLYIGGTGPLSQRLQDQINRLQLNDRVKMLGYVADHQLGEMYAAADAVVIPTRALECFGLIALEAMGVGTPVLSTPVGALPEIISRIEPKWLSRDNSAEAIADVMADFIELRLPYHSADDLIAFVERNYKRSTNLGNMVNVTLQSVGLK